MLTPFPFPPSFQNKHTHYQNLMISATDTHSVTPQPLIQATTHFFPLHPLKPVNYSTCTSKYYKNLSGLTSHLFSPLLFPLSIRFLIRALEAQESHERTEDLSFRHRNILISLNFPVGNCITTCCFLFLVFFHRNVFITVCCIFCVFIGLKSSLIFVHSLYLWCAKSKATKTRSHACIYIIKNCKYRKI